MSFAQEEDGEKAKTEKSEKGGKSKGKSESLSGDKKAMKHNQEQYFKDESGKEDYNYKDRVKVSPAVMPPMDSDSADYFKGKKRSEQQKAFSDSKYYFPAKPRNQWEIGANLGSFLVISDVDPQPMPWKSFGVGIHARRSFGYMFSLRASYLFGQARGRDWVPNQNLSQNPALNGQENQTTNYYINQNLQEGNTTGGNSAEGMYFHNYRTSLHEVGVQGVFTFGNINFHKERTLINFNAYLGLGGALYNTKTDALDENGNIYDFSEVLQVYYGPPTEANPGSKGEVLDALNALRDGSYESEAESDGDDLGEFQFMPTFTVGGAIGFHLSKRVTLSVDSRLSFTVDDLLDGNQWQVAPSGRRQSNGQTRDYDNFIFTSVGVHVHLGKDAIEPLYWMNPMDFAYKKLGEMDPEKMIDDLLKDDDEDGVPNRLDQEENTVSGAPVDPKGVALDSDKDGVIDLLDLEPFSPPGYPIDDNGIAQLPQEDKLSPEMIQQSLNCDQVELPSIHFELDRYYIRPEYYAHLHMIAEKMQICPELRVSAVGHTDVRNTDKYNQQLSWNRVNEAINYLVEKYALDRGRFIVQFEGEESAEQATNEFGHLLNRRVDFRIAGPTDTGESEPAAPFPDMKAGTNKR